MIVRLIIMLEALLVIRLVLSFVRKEEANGYTRLLCKLFEPVLAPLQKVIPPLHGIDLSPVVIFIILDIIKHIIR